MNIAGKRILVADDEQFNRMLLTAILKKHGAVYVEATNGREVLERLAEEPYDLILMDVRMPELNGLEATAQIRKLADQQKAATPIIALTAGLESEKVERCREAGMNDFVAKPYREAELMEKITRLLA